MIDNNYQSFHSAWIRAHKASVSNQMPDEETINYVFELLMDYQLSSVINALKVFGKKNKFAPTANDVIEILDTGNKRPGADEAWAMRPESEDATTVWTEEMAQAYQIAFPLIQDGDLIGARMAFKSSYERLCSESSIISKPILWKVSIGYDKSQIKDIVYKAVEQGKLTSDQVIKYIPAPKHAGPIAGLLTGKVVDINSKENKKIKGRLQGIKDQLSAIDKQHELDEQHRQEAEIEKQNEFKSKKREAEILLMQKDLNR